MEIVLFVAFWINAYICVVFFLAYYLHLRFSILMYFESAYVACNYILCVILF